MEGNGMEKEVMDGWMDGKEFPHGKQKRTYHRFSRAIRGGGRKEDGRDERLASVRVCLDWIGLEIGNRKLPWMSEFDIRT